jgi:hypothetical protein
MLTLSNKVNMFCWINQLNKQSRLSNMSKHGSVSPTFLSPNAGVKIKTEPAETSESDEHAMDC